MESKKFFKMTRRILQAIYLCHYISSIKASSNIIHS